MFIIDVSELPPQFIIDAAVVSGQGPSSQSMLFCRVTLVLPHQIESAWSHSTSRLLTAYVVIIDVSELPWLVSLVLLHQMLPCSLG